MLRNSTIGRYLCFYKHWRTNLSPYLNIPMKASFFWKGIQYSSLIIEMMIQKNLQDLEKMMVLIASHVQVFLGNKYNSHVHSTQNAKVTSARNIYEKTVMKRKNKDFQRRI